MAAVGRMKGSCIAPPPSPMYVLRGSESPVTVVEFTNLPGGSLLSGCQNGRAHLWDLTTRRSCHSFDAHNGMPVLSAMSPASDVLMTQGRDGFFNIWKCTGPEYILDGKLQADGDGFCSGVLLSQENTSSLVAVPSQCSTIQLYNLQNRSLVRTLSSPSGADQLGLCMCMCAVPTEAGTRLMAGYESGQMILWDIGTGKAQHECSAHEDAIMCVSFSARLKKGLSGSVSERLVVWSISSEGKINIVREVGSTNPGFNDVTIRPDDRIAATAGWDKKIRVFAMKSMRPLAVLAYHRKSVRSVRFSKDHLLAAGSDDHLISLWDIYREV